MTATARVEVLTAEVRVLMVGSRQVTLSVYAQLDWVKPGEIDPFGRVRPRDADPDHVEVVGASARDADRGTLVRSRYWTAAEWRRQAESCRSALPAARERDALVRELAEPEIPPIRRQQVQNQLHHIDARTYTFREWTAADLEETIRESGGFAEQAALWEALPLIVLAGLR